MMRQITFINWRYIGDSIPAFVTVMFIPFGYSAAYGLIAGLMTYTALNGLIWLTKVVTRGYIVPDDEDQREYWTGMRKYFIEKVRILTLSSSHAQGPIALVHVCISSSRFEPEAWKKTTRRPCEEHRLNGVWS